MGNRLIIEVNGSNDVCDMMRNLVMRNPQTMRIVDDDREEETVRFKDLEINLNSRKVRINDNEVFLTAREFDILLFFVRNPGRVFSHCEIYEAVWNKKYVHDAANITSHIGHIRKKLEFVSNSLQYIQTVHGVGYRFG